MTITYPDFHSEYERTLRELEQLGRTTEAAELRRLGYQVFLSDPHAALPRGVYFCGLKPYGSPGKSYPAGVELPPGYSGYRDGTARYPFYARARMVIRRALDSIFEEDIPLEAALCTNWFFYRAADTAQLKRFGLEQIDCSDHHRAFVEELSPRLIVCAGNGAISSYAGFTKLFDLETTRTVPVGGNIKVKIATSNDFRIIGFPHFSRYPVSEEILHQCGL